MESRMQHKHEIYLARGGRSYTQAVTSTRGSSAGWSMRLAITCPASSKYISNRRARANLLNSKSYDDSAILQKSSPQPFLFKCEEYLSKTYFLPSFHYICCFMAALSHRSQRCQAKQRSTLQDARAQKNTHISAAVCNNWILEIPRWTISQLPDIKAEGIISDPNLYSPEDLGSHPPARSDCNKNLQK